MSYDIVGRCRVLDARAWAWMRRRGSYSLSKAWDRLFSFGAVVMLGFGVMFWSGSKSLSLLFILGGFGLLLFGGLG